MTTVPQQAVGTRHLILVAMLVTAWFALALWATAAGVFVGDRNLPPIGIGLAVAGPVVAAMLALTSTRVRALVQQLDLRMLVSLQAWRTIGFAFLVLAAMGRLPAGFALPAGLGDIAIALTAPFVAAALPRARRTFLVWTALGIADLLVAVTLGVLYSASAWGVLVDGTDAAAVTSFPLALIPVFLVPLSLVVHLLSLVRARRV